MTENPFTSPASNEAIKWADHEGHLLLVEPTGLRHGVQTRFGENDAVEATITVLDPAPTKEYPDTLIFPKVLVSQTRSKLGQKVLGRLTKGSAKTGQSAPWQLSDGDENDIELGKHYLLSRKGPDVDPFQANIPF